jgi:hypothetical protein
MTLKRSILLIVTAASLLQARPEILEPVQNRESSFAIIIDRASYSVTEAAVLAYRDAVEADGLSTYIVIEESANPDELRRTIIDLKSRDPRLEGVVFVGDIPIPMIRDAQHLASAFKMDQERFAFQRSSIPSDRFYDDFDLQFNFLEQDTGNTLLYYYSLSAESPQKIQREIYSARIRPPFDGQEKYIQLAKYLRRVAAQKREQNRLDNLMRYAGHGYNSEALSAWEGEALALREQFPQIFAPGGTFTSLEHSMSDDIKTIIINALQQPELDVAIFHAHGGVEAQYLAGYPEASSISQNVEAIKLFLRSKLRQAQRRKRSVAEAKTYYMENYGVPEAWFEGTFDDSVIVADSIYSANLDLDISDVALFTPGAELIIFDECFNGSFHRDRYIAGEYVFGASAVIAGIANSVNVKQDVWTDEGLGLLNYNIRIGQWHRERNYLENHIIGDPTFRFTNSDRKDWGRIIARQDHKIRFWEKLLRSDEIPLKSLAVRKLYRLKKTDAEPQLLTIYENDPSYIVRLSALKCLADLRSKSFEEILFKSVDDPYELIRRFTVNWMGVIGREDYLPVLARKIVTDPSERVTTTAKSAIVKINIQKAKTAVVEAVKTLPDLPGNQDMSRRLERSFQRSVSWLYDELIPALAEDTLSLKKRIREVRTFRNYQFQEGLPYLLSCARNVDEEAMLRKVCLEALGWYSFSNKRDSIIAICKEIARQENVPEIVRQEALKTKARILCGSNDPVNP